MTRHHPSSAPALTREPAPPAVPSRPDAAVLRLAAGRPLVWRTPTDLQVGVDPVLAVLDGIDDAQLRLVDALVVGVTLDRLHALAAHLGVRREQVERLLTGLGAALDAGRVKPPRPAALAVIGRGLGAQRVAAVLTEAGHPMTVLAPGALDETPRQGAAARRVVAAVIVSTHVVEPREPGRWLRRDVPHLPIVFGEAAATVGPLVLPGTSACLACVEHRRAQADPARSAIAAQLWGTPAAAETPALALEAAIVARTLLREATAATSVRIDLATGARSTECWLPSPDCACLDLSSRAEPAARRGTGSEHARLARASAALPTRARARDAPG